MASFIKTQILGYVAKDAELRFSAQGLPMLKFSVSVKERRAPKPMYWNVTVFGKAAESVAQYVVKGSLVHVDGQINMRQWEQDQIVRTAYEVTAPYVTLVSSPSSSTGHPGAKEGVSIEDQYAGPDTELPPY